jgi:pimeloyl-ACP methyl ester carboxylesterase
MKRRPHAAGIRFDYRRFGKSEGVPLLFLMHFTGTMDHWDPAVVDGFARYREVVLDNNAGKSSSAVKSQCTIYGGQNGIPGTHKSGLWSIAAPARIDT